MVVALQFCIFYLDACGQGIYLSIYLSLKTYIYIQQVLQVSLGKGPLAVETTVLGDRQREGVPW